MALPPSRRIATSNDTRVRTDGFWNTSANVFPDKAAAQALGDRLHRAANASRRRRSPAVREANVKKSFFITLLIADCWLLVAGCWLLRHAPSTPLRGSTGPGPTRPA